MLLFRDQTAKMEHGTGIKAAFLQGLVEDTCEIFGSSQSVNTVNAQCLNNDDVQEAAKMRIYSSTEPLCKLNLMLVTSFNRSI